MAEQQKPVVRRVALKIIKLGMDTRQVVARFEQERQALAMMDHPNIAKVFDAGTTETGRPYFVMELCEGEPIEQYCDQHSLGIDERLELFAQVCNAVQHAHSKGIIHRDIKPSNMLVTHARRPRRGEGDRLRHRQGNGEQAHREDAVHRAPAADRHAGIHEPRAGGRFARHRHAHGCLFAGRAAVRAAHRQHAVRQQGASLGGRMPRSSGSSARSIRRKPSTRLSRNADTIATVAAHRQIEPRKLGKLVRGELDWIVMKALEKDRHRRYETANGLANDVRRYLVGEAVVAAPPSQIYRVQKFVQRNKGAVASATAVAAALLIGLVAFAWQAKVARHATRSGGHRRSRSRINAPAS